MNTQLVALETLRQRLDKIRNTIGTAYDYLDRGRPDAEQRVSATERIARMEAEGDALEARLAAEVYRLRVEAPAVIEAWIGLHLSVLDDVLAETADAAYLSRADVRHFVAEETVAAWRSVQDGARSYVHINPYYLDDYQARLQARVPILDPVVRKRTKVGEGNIGKQHAKVGDLEVKDAD